MAVTAALVFAVAAGGTMAAQRVQSGTLSLGLNAATLDIHWQGSSTTAQSNSDIVAVKETNIMPGDTYEFVAADENYSVQNLNSVQNNGNTSTLPAYVRVTVTKYWCENDSDQKDQVADAKLITLNCDTDSWTELQSPFGNRTKSQTQVFYYKTPLDPGEATTKLLQSLSLSTEAGNEYSDRQIYLEAKADAVQYVPGDNELNEQAILSAWGVQATLNADGSIATISN